MTDYNATCARYLDEILDAGLHNECGGNQDYTALRRLQKSGREIRNRYEALLLADALNIGGIYRDWFLGDWVSDAGYVWWAPGDVTKCDHGGPDTKRCKCPKTSATRLMQNVKKPAKVRQRR